MRLRIVSDKVSAVIQAVVILFLVILLVVLAAQILSRFLPFNMMSWTDEAVQFLFVWFVFLGGALLVYRNDHLYIDLLEGKLTGRWKRMQRAIVLLSVVSFGAFLTYAGYDLSVRTIGKYSPILLLPYSLWYLAIPLCGLLIVFFTVVRLWEMLISPDQL